MRIKTLGKEFLEEKSDRIDMVSGLQYNTIFNAYIGVEDEESLDVFLYETAKKLNARKDSLIVKEGFKITTDFQKIENSKKDYELIERVGFKNSGLSFVNNRELNNLILTELDKIFVVLDSEIGINKANFATKFMLWIEEYLKEIEIDSVNIPKCLFYGDIKKHESCFLMFLNMCGFDVMYINPSGLSGINTIIKHCPNMNIDEYNVVSNYVSFDSRVSNGETIEKTSIDKISTVTASVQKRIQEELMNDTGITLDAWQLQDKKIKPIILNTTFEEIEVYYKQPFNFRPHYKLEDNTIEGPVFFSKIIGVLDDERAYCSFVNTMKKDNSTLFIEFNGEEASLKEKEFERSDYSLIYLIDENGKFKRNEIIDKPKFEIGILDVKTQNKILDALEDVWQLRVFKEELSNDVKVKSLHFALNLNRKLLLLLQNFAYGKTSPKLVLYIKDRVVFSTEFAVIMLLMNRLGIDIFIITPSASRDIERVVSEDLIDSHRLDKIVDDFNLSELEQLKTTGKNFIGKLFEKIKK